MYNVLITAHGLVMIFGFIMPVALGGFTNYFLPGLLGLPDMLFARLNNLSYWVYLLGTLFLLLSSLVEEGAGLGWTLYPALSCVDFHSSIAVDIAMFSVHMLGISSLMNSINVIGTILACRRRYFGLNRITLFVWGILLTSALLVIVLPVLAGGVTMILLDRSLNTCFYDVLGGGDLVLFQHLFWFFGHPEVYIIILPIFGLVSMLIETHSGKSVFSSLSMIYSMSSISILGFFVWAHHMFTVGLDLDSRAYFGSITLIIGVPTAIKIFNWIYSIFSADIIVWVEMLFVIKFLVMFVIGGITGLILANIGVDVLLHDTYFVVAHFHYVLSLGAVVGVTAGIIHFMTRWTFLEYSYFYTYIIFSVFLIGSNLVFLPLHSLGLLSFPRRVSNRDKPGRDDLGGKWKQLGEEKDQLSEGEVRQKERTESRRRIWEGMS